MSVTSRFKRLVYLTHRWTGIAGCLLMLMWFVSGIVMLYVGYPKLTPWERLAALPELDARSCCVSVHEIAGGLASGTSPATTTPITLTSIAGAPSYISNAGGQLRAYDGLTGQPRPATVTATEARLAADGFTALQNPYTSAVPKASYHGLIDEDRWTHARGLDAHRPLHKLHVHTPEPATLYVSSRTGQVVLDAPLTQQRWNVLGAWLHWLYFFRSTSVDPVWTWIVIVLSFMGTVSAMSGLFVGLWRWRFSRRYKSGSRSPYREPWMKWHHVTGLLFGGFVCLWIFSGLMSVNPQGIFSAQQKPDSSAYAGDRHIPPGPLADPATVIAGLNAQDFRPSEMAWHSLDGQAYVLAYDRHAQSRVVRLDEGRLTISRAWEAEQVAPAARRLFDSPVREEKLVLEHESYYYQRHPEAMNGALVRGLPAWRIDFLDPDRTRVYIDLNTGLIATSISLPARIGRWLFYFLHSWDTPTLLAAGWLRDAVLIALSLGGIIVSVAGIVIGWRRLRRTAKSTRTKGARA